MKKSNKIVLLSSKWITDVDITHLCKPIEKKFSQLYELLIFVVRDYINQGIKSTKY